MYLVKTLSVALAGLFLGLGASQAATISAIEVGGASDAAVSLSNGTQNGVATTFTLADSLWDASFDFEILCTTATCSGRIFLMSEDVTSGSPSIFSTLSTVNYSVGTSFSGVSVSGFSGIDLIAGTYSVMMTEISGVAAWLGSTAPVIDATLGSDGGSIRYDAPSDLLPEFTSYSYFGSPVLQYSLIGDDNNTEPSPVPLPASGFLLLGAFAAMLLRRR